MTDLSDSSGPHGPALSHIRSGVQILTSTGAQDLPSVSEPKMILSPSSRASLEALKVAFARLDPQLSQVG